MLIDVVCVCVCFWVVMCLYVVCVYLSSSFGCGYYGLFCVVVPPRDLVSWGFGCNYDAECSFGI